MTSAPLCRTLSHRRRSPNADPLFGVAVALCWIAATAPFGFAQTLTPPPLPERPEAAGQQIDQQNPDRPRAGGGAIGQLFPSGEATESSAEAAESRAAAAAELLARDDRIARWIMQLGANQFAVRERATASLMSVGREAIPLMRKLAEETSDPEVRLRAAEIAEQLARSDFEARVEAFLAGDEVGFEGWNVARAILGDSPSIREVFVEMLRTHPTLVAALEGTARDRTHAMEDVITRVQQGRINEGRRPTRADALALLLPANDENVPVSPGAEQVILGVLKFEAANGLQQDPQLSGPFTALVGNWFQRTSLANRQDVLWTAMQWGLPETLPLALQTLTAANDPGTLALALQAIARFGNETHTAAVETLLGDSRPASERGFTRRDATRTEVGDVAMATIALLNDVSLGEVGFPSTATHETFGFVIEDLGFPITDEKARKAARQKVDAILKER